MKKGFSPRNQEVIESKILIYEPKISKLAIVLSLDLKIFKTVMVRRGILAIKFYCEHAKSNNT